MWHNRNSVELENECRCVCFDKNKKVVKFKIKWSNSTFVLLLFIKNRSLKIINKYRSTEMKHFFAIYFSAISPNPTPKCPKWTVLSNLQNKLIRVCFKGLYRGPDRWHSSYALQICEQTYLCKLYICKESEMKVRIFQWQRHREREVSSQEFRSKTGG